jgi:Cys/Met metabolism PLP-dependent enzyme
VAFVLISRAAVRLQHLAGGGCFTAAGWHPRCRHTWRLSCWFSLPHRLDPVWGRTEFQPPERCLSVCLSDWVLARACLRVQFIQTVLPKMGITATVIDPSDMEALRDVLADRTVSLFFSESPTNPYLRQGRARMLPHRHR